MREDEARLRAATAGAVSGNEEDVLSWGIGVFDDADPVLADTGSGSWMMTSPSRCPLNSGSASAAAADSGRSAISACTSSVGGEGADVDAAEEMLPFVLPLLRRSASSVVISCTRSRISLTLFVSGPPGRLREFCGGVPGGVSRANGNLPPLTAGEAGMELFPPAEGSTGVPGGVVSRSSSSERKGSACAALAPDMSASELSREMMRL